MCDKRKSQPHQIGRPATALLPFIGRLLNRPLFGTQVIPHDARINLDRLPEVDFPLSCEKCGYLLRGLPDDRCPECGSTFDRHHLFLKNYVHQWFDALVRTTPVGRVIRWSCFGGIALVLMHIAGMLIVGLAGPHILNLPTSRPVTSSLVSKSTGLIAIVEHCVWMTEGLLLICILVGFVWATKEIRHRLRQRRMVVDAIISPDPGRTAG